MTQNVPLTINVSAGETEYVGGTITDINGKNISAATFDIGFILATGGVITAPTGVQWVSPSLTTVITNSSVQILFLVPTSQTPGVYSVWGRMHDTPEVLPRLLAYDITVQ